MRSPLLLATLITLSAVPAVAEPPARSPIAAAPAAAPSSAAGLPSPAGLAASDTDVYAQGQQEHADGWHFIYGPLHSAGDKSAVYVAQARNGGAMLSCGSRGTAELVVGMAGVWSAVGTDEPFLLTIGSTTHTLMLRAAKNPPKQRETVYYASGMDVLGIIRTMASVNLADQTPDIIRFTDQNRRLSLPSPWPAGSAQEMYTLCAGWNNKHAEAVSQEDARLSKTAPAVTASSGLNRPRRAP